MKILYNTDQTYLHGGIEKVMATKLNYWAALPNVEVFVVTTEQNGNSPCYSLDEKVKQMDLGVNYQRSVSYFSVVNLKKAWKHFWKQRKIFKELQPDVIISPNYNFDHYWLPFIKGKAQLIKERHGSRYFEEVQRKSAGFLQKLKFFFNDGIDSKYNHIVVLNEDEKKYVKSGNAVVIPNPITLQQLHADTSSKKVIAAGRIAPVKGFEDLVQAWSLLALDFPDWQLHIYGEDYLGTKNQLEQLIHQLKLENDIHFKGSVDHLPKTMTDYSIYAMTSETECFPMVLLEALSVGLPIVSFDCPNGPRNIITPGEDGILVEHKNTKAFADGLRTLMMDENKRKEMSQNAIKNSHRFEVSQVMKHWNKLVHLSHV